MMRRNISGRVPRKSPVAGIEDSESHSFSPRFTVEPWRDCIALVSGQAAPDRVASVEWVRSSEELRPDPGANAVGTDNCVMLDLVTAFKVEANLAVQLF